jgi:hypothetical protein
MAALLLMNLSTLIYILHITLPRVEEKRNTDTFQDGTTGVESIFYDIGDDTELYEHFYW